MSDDALPKYTFSRITDITPEDLTKMGAKAVAIDLDNTTFYDGMDKMLPGADIWVRKIREAGFPVIIVTNTGKKRGAKLASVLGVPFFANAMKPNVKGIYKAAMLAGVEVGELAMIGDQLFTDIRGANRAGAISVRVEPFMTEFLLYFRYRIVRMLENRYLRKHKNES